MITWQLNGTDLGTIGLRLISGSFRTMGPSVMRIERSSAFDATELLAYGTAVTLTRVVDSVPTKFFQGKVTSVPKGGNAESEYQVYDIEDAWAELEQTIYQEEWALGASTVLMPKFVLGIIYDGSDWVNADAGAQIESVINYAISQGINLQLGSVPTGQLLIPSEYSNTSCAEVIALCLKQHPDWIPWIDHSTTVPTFNVTKVSDMSAASIAVDGSGSVGTFNVIKRDDLLPASVRIVYEFANQIDDEVYRNIVVDKYPLAGPDGGPRVLQATIPLQGMQMQMQKSRIQTRALPTDNASLKAWLKLKIPRLADVPDGEIEVVAGSVVKSLVTGSDTHPDPINENAPRLEPSDVDDLPRELVKGSVEDWMRKMTGKVKVEFKIRPNNTTTAANREILEAGIPPAIVVTATNATTKLYKGITQWVVSGDVPTGIAQQTYDAIHSSMLYQGTVQIFEEETGGTRYHGKKLNITGGVTAWATMGAPVHSVDFDLDAGSTTISFGPVPYLAPADFIEMQRIMRYRPVKWWSFEERQSNQFGGASKASSAGDSVGVYDLPETVFEWPENNTRLPFAQRTITDAGGGNYTVTIWPGWIRETLTVGGDPPPDGVVFHMPEIEASGGTAAKPLNGSPPPEFSMTDGQYLAIKYKTDKFGNIKTDTGNKPTILVATTKPETAHYQPPDSDGIGGLDGEYQIIVGQLDVVAGLATLTPYQNSDIEHYHEIQWATNLGSGGKFYKQWKAEDDAHQFRTLNARFGTKVETSTDEVDLDADLSNQGTGAAVWIEPDLADPEDPLPDEPIKLRTIRALSSAEASTEGITPQIQVSVEDEPGETASPASQKKTIRVRGNGINGALIAVDCAETETTILEWEDGLIVTSGDVTINLGECQTTPVPT